MATATNESAVDMGTGVGVLFGLLAVGSAGLMMFGDGLLRATGFGAAIVFAALTVAALQVYR